MSAQQPPSPEGITGDIVIDSPTGAIVPGLAPGLTREDFERVNEAYENRRAPGTCILYSKHWKYFCGWCEARGIDPLPADPFVVASYLSERASKLKTASVRIAAAAIRSYHLERGYPSPFNKPALKGVMQGLSRQYPHPPQQVTGISESRFFLIITRAYDPKAYDPKTWEPPGAAQSRASLDLALIALMRDAMLRRSEAAAARWRDLQREPDGTGRLTILVSKVDQVGKGAVLFVSEATMECLDTMLHYRDGKAPSSEDTIFGIGERQVANRIKAAAAHAGLEGGYGGHSPRIGMAMDLARDNVELPGMMQAGRWRSPEMPARYIRGIAAGKGAVAGWHQRHGEAIRVKTLWPG